jgi:putative heme iron utilization protein
MAEQLTKEVIDNMCKHINEHHADAVLVLAQSFGNCVDAAAATVLLIDPQGMDVTAQVNDAAVPIRIQFDHILKDAEDAKNTIVAMVKKAKSEA